MGSILRYIVAGGLGASLALGSFASFKGVGTPRLAKQEMSARNQSLFGPWFMGRGYRGGK